MPPTATVILEKHPEVSSTLTVEIEENKPRWEKIPIRKPESGDQQHGSSPILACARQRHGTATSVRFLHEKGGFFGIIRTTERILSLLLPEALSSDINIKPIFHNLIVQIS
jgi:hypothetical protein